MIFDIHDKNGRLASAVLLDKVKNLANDACLEILGLRPDADLAKVIRQFITSCKDQAPALRAGFQLSIADTSTLANNFFGAMGLKYYYSNYEMENPAVTLIPIARVHSIQAAEKSDAESVYKVLCESFSKNPEISIPEASTWHSAFLKSQGSRYDLWREHGRIIGFANLIESEAEPRTEVRTVGVLPKCQGNGIGKDLLQNCLNETAKLGHSKCNLTVAVDNDTALGLYTRSGFMVTANYNCFGMDF